MDSKQDCFFLAYFNLILSSSSDIAGFPFGFLVFKSYFIQPNSYRLIGT